MNAIRVLLALVFSGWAMAAEDGAVRDGLVFHAAFDKSGAHAPATARGDVGTGEGRVNGGLQLAGKGCLVGLPPVHNQDLTWAAWIRTRSPHGGVMGMSNDRWSQGAKGIYLSGGRLKLDVGWVGAGVAEPQIDDGEWHHVALTLRHAREGNDQYELYVDGMPRKTGRIAFYRFDGRDSQAPAEKQDFRIGHLAIADAGYFKGDLDDVATWSRALGPAEINLVYAAGRKGEALASILDVHNVSPLEPGVRFRLYWLGAPSTRMPTLVPDQSPNIDRTVPGFDLKGDEPCFADDAGQRYASQYIAVMGARVSVSDAGAYEMRIADGARARVIVNGVEVIRPGTASARVDLAAGPNAVVLEQHIDQPGTRLRLEWRPPGQGDFEAISADALRAERFYFRPTNAGRKFVEIDDARPGNGRKLAGLHPAYRVTTIRPAGVDVPVGGLGALPDGRLAVAVFNARKLRAPRPQPEPDGALWIMDGVYGDDPAKITRQVIAEDLYEPVGVCVVGDAIYVSQRDNILRFSPDGKGGYVRTIVASGWETNDFHALTFGLIHQPGPAGHPGWLYVARSVGLGLALNPPNHGAVWKIDLSKPAGSNLEVLTGGHRTPNGIGFGPEGEIYVTDNQGEWTPSNELNRIAPGSFYGYVNPTGRPGANPSPFVDQPLTEPAVHLPQDEIANSPSEPILIPPGAPYAGQMLVGDVRYGGLNRIFLEKVGGQWQGAVFRFSQGMEGGTNRLAWGRNGTLFVGCIGGEHASTWTWVDPAGRATYQGLQRLTPTGIEVFDLKAIRATPDGFEIEFTQPADAKHLREPGNYVLRQWNYHPTAAYGGEKKNLEILAASSVIVSDDGRKARLKVAGLKAGRVVYLKVDPPSAKGEPIWSAEAWYTLHRIPQM